MYVEHNIRTLFVQKCNCFSIWSCEMMQVAIFTMKPKLPFLVLSSYETSKQGDRYILHGEAILGSGLNFACFSPQLILTLERNSSLEKE